MTVGDSLSVARLTGRVVISLVLAEMAHDAACELRRQVTVNAAAILSSAWHQNRPPPECRI